MLLKVVFHPEIFREENQEDERAEVPERRVIDDTRELHYFHFRERFILLIAGDLPVDE